MTADHPDRRTFLVGGAAALGGAALAVGGRAAWDADQGRRGAASDGSGTAAGTATVPFRGARQAGVGTPPAAFATVIALDLVPGADRDAIVRLMRIWTDDIERLTQGRPGLTDTEPELALVPASLTVTVGYGSGLFSAAGLDRLRPAWLSPIPAFAIDRLQPAWCGGDLVLQVCADDELTIRHAARLLVRQAGTFATVRWVQRGFRRSPGTTPPGTTMRNLMGQLDGTRNLSPVDDEDLIWHDDTAPDWLVGGTSMVLRRIAMDLDTWDGVDRPVREAVLGRRMADGAPLTGTREHDEPDLEALNDIGFPVIDIAAHIRRARTADPGQRFLRRGYSYDDGPGAGGPDGTGLLFITFQRDVTRQFVPVQQRLAELDLLNTWITPVGSASFAIPGGCPTGEYLGQRLLES
ncbi:Dyp-type peroxidase [Cellulomonas sp. KRMCY2]|uniref:Dyp-type peroxidase n=1 Tax=Cellulomonas sp. KRMCY2 TaxID=1304865 RepID=UPI00045EB96A|nr:Dyp-type peroxidase [Cellulomonas sp. KRMCY2]